jgi:hypothetical protein
MITEDIKKRITELKTLYEEVTISDLQGIAYAIILNIKKDINAIDSFYYADILLSYASGEIDLNKCLEEIEVLKC